MQVWCIFYNMNRRNDLTLKEKQELLKKFDNLHTEGSVDDDETEEDETDQHVLTLPSHAEVCKALEVLRTTVQAKCSDADFAMHYNYENFINHMLAGNCKQTTLDTYFTH